MLKFVKILGLTMAMSLILIACSQKYDEDIQKVIDLRNEDLKEYNVNFNIDKVTKKNSCFKVYNDGEYIAMFVPLHSDDEKEEYIYKKQGSSYELYSDSDYESILEQEPDYTLNCDK